MCSEIYISQNEAIRPNRECWCPLNGGPEGEPTDTQKQAYLELGKLVWDALQRKHQDINARALSGENIDQSKAIIEVEWKLW